MTIWDRVRILPLLVMVAGLSFVVRVGEFVVGFDRMGSALAMEEVKDPAAHGAAAVPPPLPSGDKPAAEAKAETAEAPAAPAAPAVGEAEPKEEWRDAGDEDIEYSPIQADLYKDLMQRREDIESRERTLAAREALLEAAERELDQKLRELTTLKNEIEGLLKQQSDEELARITSLVKIYEGMKAKDAARIFNTLDIDVLLQVLTKMSERKSAPIIAEMDNERARTVTILMAQQRNLPALPPQ